MGWKRPCPAERIGRLREVSLSPADCPSLEKAGIENGNAVCYEVLLALKNPIWKEFVQQMCCSGCYWTSATGSKACRLWAYGLFTNAREGGWKSSALVLMSVWKQELQMLVFGHALIPAVAIVAVYFLNLSAAVAVVQCSRKCWKCVWKVCYICILN